MRRTYAVVAMLLATFPVAAACPFDFVTGYFAAGEWPTSLATADFNNDGRLDVAVALNDTDKVAILLGASGGGFANPVEVSVGRVVVGDIAAGDVNGDGHADIAAASGAQGDFSSAGAVHVLFGNGSGGFTAATPYELNQNPYYLLIDDFNRDGKGDVAVAKMTSFVMLLGTATGLTQKADMPLSSSASFLPDEITHGDFDGDAKLDVAVSNPSDHQIHTFYGIGDGRFTVGPILPYDSPYWGGAITADDFDGDGDVDIAHPESGPTGETTKKLSVYLSNGSSRTFAAPVKYGDFGNPSGVTDSEGRTADIDGDGDIDVAVAMPNGIYVLFNDGHGGFTSQRSFASGWGLAVGDFDNDGGPDLVTSIYSSPGDVYLLANSCGQVALTLSSSANPSDLGSSVSFTATVVPPSAATPTGMLALERSGAAFASGSLATSLSLSAALSDLPAGTTAITATYSGDSRFSAATAALTQTVQLPPFGAPTGVAASGSGGQINVSWTGTRDVAHYEIWRRGAGNTWTLIGTASDTVYVDSTVSASAAYLYKVRGVSAESALSEFSIPDLGSTFTFTDESIAGGVTIIRLAHLTELRNAADAARAAAGLAPFLWSDASPNLVKASHWTELRTGLEEARYAGGIAAGVYSSTPVAGGPVLVSHVTELRANAR